MMRIKLRRHPQKEHRTRRALVAVGAFGAAAGGIRRWRHRHHPEQPEH